MLLYSRFQQCRHRYVPIVVPGLNLKRGDYLCLTLFFPQIGKESLSRRKHLIGIYFGPWQAYSADVPANNRRHRAEYHREFYV